MYNCSCYIYCYYLAYNCYYYSKFVKGGCDLIRVKQKGILSDLLM